MILKRCFYSIFLAIIAISSLQSSKHIKYDMNDFNRFVFHNHFYEENCNEQNHSSFHELDAQQAPVSQEVKLILTLTISRYYGCLMPMLYTCHATYHEMKRAISRKKNRQLAQKITEHFERNDGLLMFKCAMGIPSKDNQAIEKLIFLVKKSLDKTNIFLITIDKNPETYSGFSIAERNALTNKRNLHFNPRKILKAYIKFSETYPGEFSDIFSLRKSFLNLPALHNMDKIEVNPLIKKVVSGLIDSITLVHRFSENNFRKNGLHNFQKAKLRFRDFFMRWYIGYIINFKEKLRKMAMERALVDQYLTESFAGKLKKTITSFKESLANFIKDETLSSSDIARRENLIQFFGHNPGSFISIRARLEKRYITIFTQWYQGNLDFFKCSSQPGDPQNIPDLISPHLKKLQKNITTETGIFYGDIDNYQKKLEEFILNSVEDIKNIRDELILYQQFLN